MPGRRVKDGVTGAKLYHDKDGGPLYYPSRGGGNYYFCMQCDRDGRDPYVSVHAASFRRNKD